MSAPPVSVIDLVKTYGDHTAVDRLTFSLTAGSVTGMLGPNGSGKSTTLRMLLGLAAPTSGTAHVAGRPYAELEEPGRLLGAVLDAEGFHPSRSARHHLRSVGLAIGIDDSGGTSRIEEVLAMVDLLGSIDRPVGSYSLGMRQRLALATALLGAPRVLLLDEPINGLDPAGIHWLRGTLRDFAAAGGTVLLSSHVLTEVAQTVDRALILKDGALVGDLDLTEVAGDRELERAYLGLTAGEETR